jgi:hypothetical protein
MHPSDACIPAPDSLFAEIILRTWSLNISCKTALRKISTAIKFPEFSAAALKHSAALGADLGLFIMMQLPHLLIASLVHDTIIKCPVGSICINMEIRRNIRQAVAV